MRIFLKQMVAGCAAVCLHLPALAAPAAAAPRTLCGAAETVLFSCVAGDKTVSVCASVEGATQKARRLIYRAGTPGRAAEFTYPKNDAPLAQAYAFSSIPLPGERYMQALSFEAGAAYDVIMPEKAIDAGAQPFTGVSVTPPGQAGTLAACAPESLVVNLAPLKKALGLAPDALFSEALPKVEYNEDYFPMLNRKARHGKHWRSQWRYPVMPHKGLEADAAEYARDCYNTLADARDGQETGCIKKVTVALIKGRFLSMYADYYEYRGTPAQGASRVETRIFRGSKDNWTRVAPAELFDSSTECRARLNALVYRQLRPRQLSKLDANAIDPNLALSAQIALGEQGVVFAYPPAWLDAGAQGSLLVTVPYGSLGSCFRAW